MSEKLIPHSGSEQVFPHSGPEQSEGPRGDLRWGTVPALVRDAAHRFADREAVADGRTRLTYAELGARVEEAAAACVAAGLRPGDRFGIWAPNCTGWIVAALGAVSAGGVLVPLNTRFKGAEAAQVLATARARMLFVTGTFLGTSYVASLRRATAEGEGKGPLPGLPELEHAVVLSGDAPEGFLSWREFLEPAGSVARAEVRDRETALTPDAPSDIIFTSGTTGRPKGAVISHAQTLRAYELWCELAGLREGDRYLVVNPFFHTFGYKAGVLACLMRGATLIPQPVFSPETVLANIAAEGVTVLPGPPALLQGVLDHAADDSRELRSLRLVVTGASVVPLRLVRRLREDIGIATVLTAYGLSEASGIVTMCRQGDDPRTVATTSGGAVPGVEVRVAGPEGPEGEDAPAGSPGEVLVRGFNVMRGYFEEPEETRRALTADGWLRTGDVGVLDAEGNLRITDRIKDMFIVGGFNAYPAEIEQLMAGHPEVADVAVVGVPDERLGEVGRAYVVRRPQSPLTEEELLVWSRREMANYKVPRSVEFLPELPRNAGGKVLKAALRARAAVAGAADGRE